MGWLPGCWPQSACGNCSIFLATAAGNHAPAPGDVNVIALGLVLVLTALLCFSSRQSSIFLSTVRRAPMPSRPGDPVPLQRTAVVAGGWTA